MKQEVVKEYRRELNATNARIKVLEQAKTNLALENSKLKMNLSFSMELSDLQHGAKLDELERQNQGLQDQNRALMKVVHELKMELNPEGPKEAPGKSSSEDAPAKGLAHRASARVEKSETSANEDDDKDQKDSEAEDDEERNGKRGTEEETAHGDAE